LCVRHGWARRLEAVPEKSAYRDSKDKGIVLNAGMQA